MGDTDIDLLEVVIVRGNRAFRIKPAHFVFSPTSQKIYAPLYPSSFKTFVFSRNKDKD